MGLESSILFAVVIWLGLLCWPVVGVLRRYGVELFPRRRRRAVPWRLPDLALAALLWWWLPAQVWLLWQMAFRWVGPLWLPVSPSRLPPMLWPTVCRLAANDYYALVLITIPSGLVAAVCLPALLAVSCGARPYQMGLHGWQLGRNVLRGLVGYLLSAPVVAAALLAATWWFQPTPHAIERLVRARPTTGVVLATALAAVVSAPVAEEVLFRGLLLPWLQRVAGPTTAIVGSSLAFAALHADAWPAPVPLFVLALFLGYLAYRTTSLVGPVVLHSTFNAVSMLGLVLGMSRHL